MRLPFLSYKGFVTTSLATVLLLSWTTREKGAALFSQESIESGTESLEEKNSATPDE